MTQADRIARLLSGGRWVSNRELNRICFRYTARLFDMKANGFRHETKLGKSRGLVWYRRVR